MAKLTQYMNPAEISKMAKKMADEHIASMHKNGLGHEYSFNESASARRKQNAQKLMDTFTEYLSDNEFPEEEIENGTLTIADLVTMATSKKPPSAFYNKKLNDKFRADANNILFGKTDELGNVTPMTNEEVAKKATEWGVKWRDVDQRSKFMHAVGEQGKANARAQVVRDFENGKDMGGGDWTGKFGTAMAQMAFPTATDEAKRQAFTGNYNDGRLAGALVLDGVTQAGMALGAPALSEVRFLSKMPSAVQIASTPVAQGAFEATRQGIQAGADLGDGEFNAEDIGVAAVTGLTSPALKNMMKSAGGVEGAGKSFARGVASTERFQPVTFEKNGNLETINAVLARRANGESGKIEHGFGKKTHNQAIDDANKFVEGVEDFAVLNGMGRVMVDENGKPVFKNGSRVLMKTDANGNVTKEVLTPTDVVNAIYADPKKFQQFAKQTGVTAKEGVKDVLTDMIEKMKKEGRVTPEEAEDFFLRFDDAVAYAGEQAVMDELSPKFQTLFTDANTKKDKYYTAGRRMGELAGAFGGALEPTYRPNVMTLPNATMSLFTDEDSDDLIKNTNNSNINTVDFEKSNVFKSMTLEEKKKLYQALKTIRAEESEREKNSLFTDQNP